MIITGRKMIAQEHMLQIIVPSMLISAAFIKMPASILTDLLQIVGGLVLVANPHMIAIVLFAGQSLFWVQTMMGMFVILISVWGILPWSIFQYYVHKERSSSCTNYATV